MNDISPAGMNLADEKLRAETDHLENVYDSDVVMKSPFDDMSFSKTVVVFKKATAMALLAAFSAAAE